VPAAAALAFTALTALTQSLPCTNHAQPGHFAVVSDLPPPTRTFNASTLAARTPPARAGDGSSLNPWLDPLRLARCFRDHVIFWAIALGGAGVAIGALVGLVAFATTYSLSGSLQLVAAPTPFDAEQDAQTYRPPELQPRELQSIMDQQFIFERLLPMMEANENIHQFHDRFKVEWTRDAGVFRVTFTGAPSPTRAEEVLDSYFQTVLLTARDLLSTRSQKDLDYFRQQVDEADRDLKLVLTRLDEQRRQQGFVYLEQEVNAMQTKLAKQQDAMQAAKARLSDMEFRISELPKLIDSQPKEIEAAFRKQPEISEALVAKRTELGRLEALFTDEHPRVRQARIELSSLEREYQSSLEALKQANKEPNPFVTKLTEELNIAKLQVPQLRREVADMEAEVADTRTYLERLPAISAPFLALETQRERQEVLLRRLKGRLSEIEIARTLSLNTARILDPPTASSARPFSRWLKTGLAAGIGLLGGLSLAALVAGFQSVRDRRIRHLEDAVTVLNAERVTRLPRGGESVEAIAGHRRWLQDVCGHLSIERQRFLVLPDVSPELSAAVVMTLANQFACSGLVTLVLGPTPEGAPQARTPADPSSGQRSGVTQILTRRSSLRDSAIELDRNLYLVPWGDLEELLTRLPTGEIEHGFARHLEEFGGFDILLLQPPEMNQALLQRLGSMAQGIIFVIDPDTSDGLSLQDAMTTTRLPVALAILTA
jgi:uncharacterized protein involved in exopolysaccharide biosynthesis